MSNFSYILQKAFYKTVFEVKKRSPEILTGLGIIGVIGGTVLACVATTKLEKTMEKHKAEIEAVHEKEQELTKEDYRKEVTKAYARMTLDLAKLYGPAVLVEASSIGCLIGSHGIMQKRNASLAAYAATMSNAYETLRKRVADRFGEDVEKELKYDIHTEEVDEEYVDGKGKTKTRKTTVQTMSDSEPSPYSRFYDNGCDGWSKDTGANLQTLMTKQAYLNDRLRIRGYLFLNEVYEYLGMPIIQEGQYLGWFYDPTNPNLHNKVDFGIFDMHDKLKRDFVNGFENVIFLDFNFDGNIVDNFRVNNSRVKRSYQGM